MPPRFRLLRNVGMCDLVNVAEAGVPTAASMTLVVQADDDQGLDAVLCTGPEFGCIHHSECLMSPTSICFRPS